jgi:hypothetical protein
LLQYAFNAHCADFAPQIGDLNTALERMMHADIKIKGVMLSYGMEVGVGFNIWKEKIGDACIRDCFEVLSRDWLSRKCHNLFTRE